MSRSVTNKRKAAAGVLVLILAVTFWFFIRPRIWNEDSTERIGTVAKQDLIQRVRIAGTTEPIRTTIVTAAYDGYIKKLYVKLGQHVAAGDPIVSLGQSMLASESVFPVRAPFDGTVTQVLKNEGQFVKQGDAKDFIVRIDDLTKMFVNANAPEIDVLKIKSGLETVMKVSAVLERSYKGVVRDISQAATIKESWGSRSQVEYLVKIQVIDADTQLKPGMSAIVDITTNKKESVLVLAHEFVQKADEHYFVVMQDGARRDIEVGLQNESVFEITKGLAAGEQVRQVDFLKLIEKR